jgi:hypothetical protein
MDSEKRRHGEASPQRPGRAVEKKKEKEDVGNVEKEIRQMMTACLQAIELYICHVGNPGKGMPISRMKMGKRPNDVRYRQAGIHLGVIVNVIVVVDINKQIVLDRPIDGQGQACQYNGGDSF